MVTMRQLNLSSVNLGLLPALDALLRRRHVTRAAEDVGLSQPAMSHVLARLRHALGDDLLVRGPSGLVLTSRAEEMAPQVAAILDAAKAIYRPPLFEPSKVQRTLHLVGCDWHSMLIVPDLMKRIREVSRTFTKPFSIGCYVCRNYDELNSQASWADESRDAALTVFS